MVICATIITLASIAGYQAEDLARVRIGVFGLLKPSLLEIRVSSGEAYLTTSGESGGGPVLQAGSLVQIRTYGNLVSVVGLDRHGRIVASRTTPEIRITPGAHTGLELRLPGTVTRYVRGAVLAKTSASRGTLSVTVTTDRELAVASVVAAEVRGTRALEALKAAAVVVRTFMVSHSGRHREEGYDFCDTTHCQLYQGDHPETNVAFSLALRAAAATTGEVLKFEGNTIEGFYTAACGGVSITPQMAWGGASSTNYPYAQTVCRWCRDARYYRWERSAGVMKVLTALTEAAGITFSAAASIETETVQPGSPVRVVRIRDRHGRVTALTVDRFRRALGRRLGWNTVLSPTFSVERRGDVFIFSGRGFGSQVGLCLAGAAAQAGAGRAYHEILSFYYAKADRDRVGLAPSQYQ